MKTLLTFLFVVLPSAHATQHTHESIVQTIQVGAVMMKVKPTLYIKCQLRFAMDCENLRRAYFDRLMVIDRVDSEDALIKVTLTDEETPTGILVHAKWSAKNVVDAELPDLLLAPQYDPFKIQSELITLISQPVMTVIRMESGLGMEELIIHALSTENPGTQEPDTSPYFVDLSAFGSANRSGMGATNPDGSPGFSTSSTSLMVSGTASRVTQRTRYSASFFGNYNKTSLPGVGGQNFTADNFSRYVVLSGVYSIDSKSKWNVATFVDTYVDRGANMAKHYSVYSALEFNLVPFRVDQPYEFRVRGGVARKADRLILPNDRGNTEENYFTWGAEIYAFWLFMQDRASLNAKVTNQGNLNHKGYVSRSANLAFTVQLNRNVSFNASGDYSYVKKNIRFPAVPDFSNPLQTSFLSGYVGGSFGTSVGITIRLGKGGNLLSRDRRFR